MRIENWFICSRSSAYAEPECRAPQLRGEVYDHPRFTDGREVTTSAVINVKDGKVETRAGSIYELGEPHPDYERNFPEAKKRVLTTEV